MFIVATVSDQINSNHIAWANEHGSYPSLKAAEKAAQLLWEKLRADADEAGSSYVGQTVIIHDGKTIY